MLKLNSIPKDDEYKFRERSVELLTQWNNILAADPVDAKDDETKDDAGATNGAVKGTDEQDSKADVSEAAAPEEEDEKALEKKIGTTVEGEKELAPEVKLEDVKADEPNVETAPEATYHPPADTVEATA